MNIVRALLTRKKVTYSEDENHVRKALKAGLFVVGGYGTSQVIRLGGNLILTRLLFPEAFGIMAIAHVFITGLALMSDIGLVPAIIRSSRTDDAQFINTAWTLQVIRGFVLFTLATSLAYPVSIFYNDNRIVYLMPVIALNSLISGFKSTSMINLYKELKQGIINSLEIIRQIVGLIVMATIAYIYRSIWALVIGGIVATSVHTLWSHFLPSPVKNRFTYNRDDARELLSFGKWILISTALMFLATQADRILLGRLLPLGFFGVYNIAVTLAEIPKSLMQKLSDQVIFPFLSKYSAISRNDFRDKIRTQRWKLLIGLSLLIGVLGSFGDFLVLFLYDPRYDQAAWIFPLLAFGMWPLILYGTIDRGLYVLGKPNYVAIGNLTKFIFMLVAVPFSFKVAGNLGVVFVVAINDLPIYVVDIYGLQREKILLIKQDLWASLLLLLVTIIFLFVRTILGLGLPWSTVG